MSENGNAGYEETPAETTSVFRADFLNEVEGAGSATTEAPVSGVEGLPAGSALLVVKRGPNAGSRFLLDHRPRRPDGIPTATSSSTT